jgi:hypothetical protein
MRPPAALQPGQQPAIPTEQEAGGQQSWFTRSEDYRTLLLLTGIEQQSFGRPARSLGTIRCARGNLQIKFVTIFVLYGSRIWGVAA